MAPASPEASAVRARSAPGAPRLLARHLGCAAILGWIAFASAPADAADPHPPLASAPGRPALKAGAKPRGFDVSARRVIAGGPTAEDVSMGAESPELRALREAERELFPPASPAPGSSWPTNLVPPGPRRPAVEASGVPPYHGMPAPAAEGTQDLAWLAHLEMPDLPVRWDERVVRYLKYFRDDPRGHVTFGNLLRHSGRYREMMRRTLRRKSLPEDLVWVSMIESGFDAAIRSPAGAAGLWQLMPETARIYGLGLDRWLDQRLAAGPATEAAADVLGDLHRRFGAWELALAGFNMGYAGLASVVRRYNTNDFWSLARTEGTLPWETTLYVPKIIAAAVVAHNLAAFGFGDLVFDAPLDGDEVNVPPGTPLSLVAQAAGCTSKDLEALNPELRASRTPPAGEGDAFYPVAVPQGKGSLAAQALSRLRRDQPALDRYVVRFGESLDQIALAHKTTSSKLAELNAMDRGEAVRGGTVLLVPHVEAPPTGGAGAAGAGAGAGSSATPGVLGALKPSVVVPADGFIYPDRKRVFYRVLVGDTLKGIGAALRVSPDDLARWNEIDPAARLQEGMTLQAFVAPETDLSHVVVAGENDVRVLPVGSEEFFAALERDRNVKRVTVTAKAGDTLESIGRSFDVTPRTMERINRRGRREALKPGDPVVVYVHNGVAAPRNAGVTATNDPTPNGPLPTAPIPDLLPLP